MRVTAWVGLHFDPLRYLRDSGAEKDDVEVSSVLTLSSHDHDVAARTENRQSATDLMMHSRVCKDNQISRSSVSTPTAGGDEGRAAELTSQKRSPSVNLTPSSPSSASSSPATVLPSKCWTTASSASSSSSERCESRSPCGRTGLEAVGGEASEECMIEGARLKDAEHRWEVTDLRAR